MDTEIKKFTYSTVPSKDCVNALLTKFRLPSGREIHTTSCHHPELIVKIAELAKGLTRYEISILGDVLDDLG